MSVLYISEYVDMPQQQGQAMQIGDEPAIATQAITYSGTHAESAAFNAATRFVRLHTDGICSIRFGTAPVAVTTDPRMAQNQTEFFGVNQALGALKVSAVTNT